VLKYYLVTALVKDLAEGFACGVESLLEKLSEKGVSVISNQLRRSSLSVPSNIAEGLGRFDGRGSKKSRDQFFKYALGSLKESQTQLRILKSKCPGLHEEIKGLEQYTLTIDELICVELGAKFEHILQDREILAKHYGSHGATPVNCPQYPANDVSCESGSGDSLCGSFCGKRKGPIDETYWVTCGFITPPTALSCVCGWRYTLSPQQRDNPPTDWKCAKCGENLNGLEWSPKE